MRSKKASEPAQTEAAKQTADDFVSLQEWRVEDICMWFTLFGHDICPKKWRKKLKTNCRNVSLQNELATSAMQAAYRDKMGRGAKQTDSKVSQAYNGVPLRKKSYYAQCSNTYVEALSPFLFAPVQSF